MRKQWILFTSIIFTNIIILASELQYPFFNREYLELLSTLILKLFEILRLFIIGT